jgi:magnesium-transporting ATPase (P-type)
VLLLLFLLLLLLLFLSLQSKEEVYFVKGALEKVLQQCTKFASNGIHQPLNTKKEEDYLAEAYEIGRKGLRGKVMNVLNRSSGM